MDVKCLEIFGGELIILYALGNFWQLLPILMMEWNSRRILVEAGSKYAEGPGYPRFCEVIRGLKVSGSGSISKGAGKSFEPI